MSAPAESSLSSSLLPAESASVPDATAPAPDAQVASAGVDESGPAAPSAPSSAAQTDAPSASTDAPVVGVEHKATNADIVEAPAPSSVEASSEPAPEIASTDAVVPLISEPSPTAPPPKPAVRPAGAPDYGNAEGVDISPPLPSEWSTAAALPPVAVYGEVLSPPSCKVRALLAFYGVPFAVPGKRRPGSPYVKRPHITIGSGDELRQVNDSVIIFRTLAGTLSGTPLSPAASDLDQELSGELPLALEAEGFLGASPTELTAYVRLDYPIKNACLVSCLMTFYGRGYIRSIGKHIRAKHPGLRTVTSYVAQFRGEFPDQAAPFYHGAAPGPLDVSIFGLLFPFMEAGIRVIETALVAARMIDWYRGVRAAFSDAALQRLLTPTP